MYFKLKIRYLLFIFDFDFKYYKGSYQLEGREEGIKI